MDRKEILKNTDASLEELNEALKKGDSKSLKAYLNAVSRFRTYSYRNIMLIMSQRPDATQVLGFYAWKDLGRFVKRNEESIKIIAPRIMRQKPEEDEDPRLNFQVVHVFDISQTEGKELPDLAQATGEPGANLRLLEQVCMRLGIYIEERTLSDGVYGSAGNWKITVNDRLNHPVRFQTLVHELAHVMMHRANRLSEIKPTIQIKELEAEAVAYVVSIANGVECKDASCDYIRLYQGDSLLLGDSLVRIRKTSCDILELMNHERNLGLRVEANYAA